MSQPTTNPPTWSGDEWRIAKAVAAMQGTAGLLAKMLKWSDVPEWRRFLEGQRQHIARRMQRISCLLQDIDALARQRSIAIQILKGGALHDVGIYAAGDRPMADIDLLVAPRQAEGAIKVLKACGYHASFKSWRHLLLEPTTGGAVHAALGEHAENPIKIELHTAIQERLPVREYDITEAVSHVKPMPGVNGYPSKSALMLHLLFHAAGNMRAHALRTIQLHDIAKLAQGFADTDWRQVASLDGDGGLPWWGFPPLALVAHYYPGSIPESVLTESKSKCTLYLRWCTRRATLSDVSWTNLKIYAFPGIGWSRSLVEASRLATSRLFPDAGTREELSRFAVVHPGASGVPWYGLSQFERVLRFLISKPPRVQAILAVAAAFADQAPVSDAGVR